MTYTLNDATVKLNLDTGAIEVYNKNMRIVLVGNLRYDYVLQLWERNQLLKRFTKDGVEEIDNTQNKTTFINNEE